jgi:hypothetical protein
MRGKNRLGFLLLVLASNLCAQDRSPTLRAVPDQEIRGGSYVDHASDGQSPDIPVVLPAEEWLSCNSPKLKDERSDRGRVRKKTRLFLMRCYNNSSPGEF